MLLVLIIFPPPPPPPLQSEDLFSLIESHEGKGLKLYVYNTDTDNCREVVITPNSAWGGDGRYGCIHAFTQELFFGLAVGNGVGAKGGEMRPLISPVLCFLLQSGMWDWLWIPAQDSNQAFWRGKEDQLSWKLCRRCHQSSEGWIH